jgi:(p)ppGpp synthase/HD superfamily hydrolase
MSIETAILIATKAHRGQVDLGGNPYILHPLRVMLALAPPAIIPSPFRQGDFMLAAILHDLIEDSDWTGEQLLDARLPLPALEAVDALTRRKAEGESYGAYIDRISHGTEIARLVKIQDLVDNLHVTRLQPQHITKYAGMFERDHRALLKLVGVVTSTQEKQRLTEAKNAQKQAFRERDRSRVSQVVP